MYKKWEEMCKVLRAGRIFLTPELYFGPACPLDPLGPVLNLCWTCLVFGGPIFHSAFCWDWIHDTCWPEDLGLGRSWPMGQNGLHEIIHTVTYLHDITTHCDHTTLHLMTLHITTLHTDIRALTCTKESLTKAWMKRKAMRTSNFSRQRMLKACQNWGRSMHV